MTRTARTGLSLLLGAGAVMFLALALAGCVTANDMLRATAATATLTSGGYRALDQADTDHQTAIRATAVANKWAANQQLEDWLATFDRARKALDAADDLVNGAYKAIPSLEGVLASRKDIAKWIALLTGAGAAVAAALTDAGVHLETGTPTTKTGGP